MNEPSEAVGDPPVLRDYHPRRQNATPGLLPPPYSPPSATIPPGYTTLSSFLRRPPRARPPPLRAEQTDRAAKPTRMPRWQIRHRFVVSPPPPLAAPEDVCRFHFAGGPSPRLVRFRWHAIVSTGVNGILAMLRKVINSGPVLAERTKSFPSSSFQFHSSSSSLVFLSLSRSTPFYGISDFVTRRTRVEPMAWLDKSDEAERTWQSGVDVGGVGRWRTVVGRSAGT